MRQPEGRADAGHVTFVRIQPTPTRLERHVVAFMTDEDPEVFHERLRAGAWGQHEGEDQVGMPFWSFEEVWQRLPPQRRAQLEDIAGQGTVGALKNLARFSLCLVAWRGRRWRRGIHSANVSIPLRRGGVEIPQAKASPTGNA